MAKSIAVFSDGTGQTVGRHDSNVLRLCKLLDLDRDDQVAIYDPGIGTHVRENRLEAELQVAEHLELADLNPDSYLLHKARAPFELGFGLGARENIRQLYVALVRTWKPGDKIFLFGFSRGAFTVRALAGLIYRCGLPQSDSKAIVDQALHWYGEHYTGLKPEARARYRAQVDAFRRAHSRPVNIRFLGVWDTVKSVGYLRPVNLPHTRHNPIIQTVRHALSLDERRSFYQPTTWGGLASDTRPAVSAEASFDLDETDAPAGSPQDVDEVWFPGCHSDVGGGYPEAERGPANNSLRWMISEARHCDLKFDVARYSAAFPAEVDQQVTHRHDEMNDTRCRQLLWWIADYAPRRDLHNEPPPPHKKWKATPAGPRVVTNSLRRLPDADHDTVSIHESARGAYDDAELPWSKVPKDQLRFVSTEARA